MVKMRTAILALVLGTFAACARTAPLAKAPSAVGYDAFMQRDLDGRIRTFNQITPENRAELVKTQITRWVAKNRLRLTPEQLKVMDENLAFVTPDLYRQPKKPADVAQAIDLETRTAAVFSREEMMQALTINAAYISTTN